MGSPIIGNGDTKIHPITEGESSCLAMALTTWALPSIVFKTMLKMNVIDIIHNAGPKAQLSANEIVAQLPTTNPNAAVTLDRLLRLLASFHILTCTQSVQFDGSFKRLYGLGPVCLSVVKNNDVASYATFSDLPHDMLNILIMIMFCFEHHQSNCDIRNETREEHLKDAVLEGATPFEKAYGMDLFEYSGKNSRFYKVFYDGMDHHSTIVMKQFLESYKGFEGISTLVDVGGATGQILSMIHAKYPSIKAINFDQPHIIKDAPHFPGVEHVAGDMYESIPKCDAIFMKWTFQLGTDEECLKLLKNCRKALPKEGKVIVCDGVIPESPQGSYQAQTVFITDVNLLALIPGGRLRTKQQYEALGKAAGFEAFRMACFACDTWIMEYLKKE
ncbi:Caffeic acid 3-O-methyltransferase [Bienertia sinuspersici]